MGAQYLLSRVRSPDIISEFSQYEFNMEYLTVTPKHVKLTPQKEYHKGIAGLKAIETHLK